MSDFDVEAARAVEALGRGENHYAARDLRLAARAPDLPADPARLARLLSLWERWASGSGLDLLAEHCAAAAELDSQPLFDTAWEFVEVGLPGVAVPLLQLLDERHPDTVKVLSELAVALRDDDRPDEVCDVLLRHPTRLEDPTLRYLLVSGAVSAGRVALARKYAGALEPAGDLAEPVQWVRGALDRVGQLEGVSSLDQLDLRGWHYALTGGLLLHLSPFGFDDGMAGRYCTVQDSPDQIRLGIARAAAVLTAWGRPPAAVLELPDPGSQALARAMGALWKLPVQPWEIGRDGLAVAYDLDKADPELLPALGQRGEQLLFVHAARWTKPPPIAPDLLTLLYQHHVAPWEVRTGVDPKTEEPPSENIGGQRFPQLAHGGDSPDTWAQCIAEADIGFPKEEGDPPDTMETLVAFAKGAPPVTGPRTFWRGGPVRSSRFI